MGRKVYDRELKAHIPASLAAQDGYLRLAAAVVAAAFEDLSDPDDEKSLDALLWLGGDESAALYCEMLQLPHPLEAICSSEPVQKVALPVGMRFRDWRSVDETD